MDASDTEVTNLELESPPPFVNMNARKKVNQDSDTENATFGEAILKMLSEMKSEQQRQFSVLNAELRDIKLQNEKTQAKQLELETAVEFITNKYDDLAVQMKSLESRVETKLHDHKNATEAYISELEDGIEDLQRKLRARSIEIKNIPFTKEEPLLQIIKNLYRTLSVDYNDGEITDQFWLPNKEISKRTLIIELDNSKNKAKLLGAIKNYNLNHKNEPLSTSSLGLPGASQIIYASDYLTKKGAKLFFLGRNLKRNHNFKYCWTVAGKVFVRKSDDAPGIELKNENQIPTLINSQ